MLNSFPLSFDSFFKHEAKLFKLPIALYKTLNSLSNSDLEKLALSQLKLSSSPNTICNSSSSKPHHKCLKKVTFNTVVEVEKSKRPELITGINCMITCKLLNIYCNTYGFSSSCVRTGTELLQLIISNNFRYELIIFR